MRAFTGICLLLMCSPLLSTAAMGAAPWMPEYEVSGRLANVSIQISGRRPHFEEKFVDEMPDLEYDPVVGRSVSPKAILVGRRPPPLDNPVVGRRVSMREHYVGTLPDLENNPLVGRSAAVHRKIVGRMVNTLQPVGAQFPTPKNQD